jgi:hypothetical protein
VRILFTGYAPVHFKCFEPLMYRLMGIDNMMWVLTEDNEAIPTLDVDLWFVAHTTPKAFPRSYKKCIQIFHGMSFRNLNAREAGARQGCLLPHRTASAQAVRGTG